MAVYNSLLQTSFSLIDQARLKAVVTRHVGDWFHAPLLTSIGLRLTDAVILVATGYRLGTTICQPNSCVCGAMVEARGLHGLACRKSAPCHVRHSQLNDVIWRNVEKTQTPANKEPVGLSRADGKRPNGATLVPWTRGKPLAWDITDSDTYATSHIPSTSVSACAAADKSAANKTAKYATVTSIHLFVSIAVETSSAGAPSRRNSFRISVGESLSSPASHWRQRVSFRGYQ